MRNFSKEEFSRLHLKSLNDIERQRVFNYLADLSDEDIGQLIEIGKQFHKSSAVNGIWFWRTLPVLAEKLGDYDLRFWLEEGVRVCRADWESTLAFLKASPEMMNCVSKATFYNWLQIGKQLVRFSTSEANRYFKTSVSLFNKIDKYEQNLLTHWVLKILESSWQPGAACLKAWSDITLSVKNECKEKLLELGSNLAFHFGEEADAFFQSAPGFVENGGQEIIELWVDTAHVITNGKRGLIRAFFGSGPGFMKKSDSASGQKLVEWAGLGNRLAASNSKVAELFFQYTPDVLRYVDWSCIKQWAGLIEKIIEENSPQCAMEFTQNTPELLKELNVEEISKWVDYGLKNIPVDKTLAFYMLKSQESREGIARLRSGLFLESVKKVLVLYCEGLTGERVIIRNASELPEKLHGDERLFGTLDTKRFYLPAVVKFSNDEIENLRFYRIMLMHLVAHRLYGTFELNLTEVQELATYPYLGRFFEFLEDARVDYLAVKDNQGLGKDIELLLKNESGIDKKRPSGNRLLDKLRSLGRWESNGVSTEVEKRLEIYWQNVLETGGSAKESLDLARWLNDLDGGKLGKNERTEANFRYRGKICFDLIFKSMELDEEIMQQEKQETTGPIATKRPMTTECNRKIKTAEVNLHNEYYTRLKELLAKFYEDEENPYRMIAFYDEWDRTLNDYKKDWCRVREILLKPSTGRIVTRTLEEHRGMVNTLKRYFGMLRPDRFRRYRRQDDGEDVDIDAVIEAMVEVKAGVSPVGGLYIKRDKRERDVAVGFLLDLSYSTDEVISCTGKTLLEVEIESVVVMSEAMEVLGDKYAVYGFNSDSREKINFYVVKDFEEEYSLEVKQRFGGLQSYGMTRLGAALRHAVSKMERIQAAVKIIIVLSDGRPFDFDYNSGLTRDYEPFYPEADTRMALREAKMKGINPFCITIDCKGKEYLEYIFGNVNYIIIDDIQALPTKLTETYKNLTT